MPLKHIWLWNNLPMQTCQGTAAHSLLECSSRQWKGEGLFCCRSCAGLGTLSSWGGQACLAASTLQLYYQADGFGIKKLCEIYLSVWIIEEHWLVIKSLNDRLTPSKLLFMKLEAQLSRNTDDLYQYTSDKVAENCFRLAFLSLLYHPFYLMAFI